MSSDCAGLRFPAKQVRKDRSVSHDTGEASYESVGVVTPKSPCMLGEKVELSEGLRMKTRVSQ